MATVYHDPWLAHAIGAVEAQYGDVISVDTKKKGLLKFGKNEDLDTSEAMIWNQGGLEADVSTNVITTVSSSSASDTGSIVIEGHTVSGTGTDAKFSFSTQTVTLDGQNQVTLTTPIARSSRMYNPTATEWVGAIAVYEDDTTTAGVPDTGAKVHLKVSAGDQQSYKAGTTFSDRDYGIITQFGGSVNRKTSAVVDFTLERRLVGGVFRPIMRVSASTTGSNAFHLDFKPYLIIPRNSDVRVIASASTTGVEVNGHFNAILAGIS